MALGFNTRKGGDVVPPGYYWNLADWEAQIIPPPGAALKGNASKRYLRLPLAALLVLAPLMGAAYAFFLPFIGFALVIAFLIRKITGGITGTPVPAGFRRPLGSLLHGGQSGSARSGCAPGASSSRARGVTSPS